MADTALDIGESLLSRGKLQREELAKARQLQNGETLGPHLVRLSLVSEQELAEGYAELCRLPMLSDSELPGQALEGEWLSPRFLRESLVLPLLEEEDRLHLAMADPTNIYALHAVSLACGKEIVPRVATLQQIQHGIEQLYGQRHSSLADIVEQMEAEEEPESDDTVERLRDLAAEAPIVRLVNLLIDRAIRARASDVHIEPFENRLQVRYRIDGVLRETESPPVRSTAAVISRIKLMAKLNIAERRLPQDGRLQLRVQGRKIDLRISTVPTLYGESLVIRILDQERVELSFSALGLSVREIDGLHRALDLPHGIVLVTGPTGSGKTTTLYTALSRLNTPERKLLTVEDPIEYQLEGINQIQIKPRIGLGFAESLRSIVRQDPDIIMIGEMRDLETARIAVQSALTGHLVFSTLHTNNAGSSVTRLLDMGVEDYLLTSTLNCILSQRLVRTLCRQCRQAYEPLPELLEELGLARLSAPEKARLYRPQGCEHCTGTGYAGRTMILEMLTLSARIRKLILARADGEQIQCAAIEEGMCTMRQAGIARALEGLTSLDEVLRVTQAD